MYECSSVLIHKHLSLINSPVFICAHLVYHPLFQSSFPGLLLQLIMPYVPQMFVSCIICLEQHVLGFFHPVFHIYCTLCHPHALSVSTSCSSSLLMFFLLTPHCFLRIPSCFLMVNKYIQSCIFILYQLIISFTLIQVFA